jgi:hypothetical protein
MNSTFSGVRQGGFGATRKAEEATLPPSGLLNEPNGSTGGDRNLECRDEPRLGEKSSALEQDRYSLVSMSDTGSLSCWSCPTSTPWRSCASSARSHDHGGAGLATSRSAAAEPRSAFRSQGSQLQTLSVNLTQRADKGVSVLVADFAVVVAVAIVELEHEGSASAPVVRVPPGLSGPAPILEDPSGDWSVRRTEHGDGDWRSTGGRIRSCSNI